jgi:hypothetical protein
MSAADKRIGELLDRWLASVELHARYLDLDDDAYARTQDWPRHQRPTRWVVELARARLLELRRQLTERQAKADAGFADSLELMGFLTTLLGSEHIERFIPQAVARPAANAAPAPGDTATPKAPTASTPVPIFRAETPARGAKSGEAGHRAKSASAPKAPPPGRGGPTARRTLAKTEKAGSVAAPGHRPKPVSTGVRDTPERIPTHDSPVPEKAIATVIADAVRFLSWGREWPQLASSIARLADRPSEPVVWKILREHRAAIEAQARRPPD